MEIILQPPLKTEVSEILGFLEQTWFQPEQSWFQARKENLVSNLFLRRHTLHCALIPPERFLCVPSGKLSDPLDKQGLYQLKGFMHSFISYASQEGITRSATTPQTQGSQTSLGEEA